MKNTKMKILSVMLMVIIILTSMPANIVSHAASGLSMTGKAHVQTFGNQNGKITYVGGYETLVLGTRGLSKRVENVLFSTLNDAPFFTLNGVVSA